MKKTLLYGANGYTAQLMLQLAEPGQFDFILAGRNEAAIQPIAEKYKLPYQIFSLDDQATLDKTLSEVHLVIHAAGPYRYTASPMMEAAIRTKTHYLDITGEVEVFEMAKSFDQAAKAAGIMLMSGTGFDVVPTDCLALFLKKQLPDATHLRLAIAALDGGVSHGTATTMAAYLGEGSMTRENGELKKVRLGHKARWIEFSKKKLYAMTIPWGDLSTAYHSTGIPNIETYAAVPPATHKRTKWIPYVNWLLKMDWVKNMVKRKIDAKPAGPDDDQREKSLSMVWGEVENSKGEVRQANFTGAEGYTFTALSTLLIAEKVMNGNAPVGYQTPSSAYGEDLVLEVKCSERELL